MDPFYRYAARLADDFGGRPVVLLGRIGFRTILRARHPAIDWIVLAPALLRPLVTEPLLGEELAGLKIHAAVLMDAGTDFDIGAALYLRSRGIRRLFSYNEAGPMRPIRGGRWLRGLLAFRPTIQSGTWAVMDFFVRWGKVLWDTALIPINLIRLILTRLLWR